MIITKKDNTSSKSIKLMDAAHETTNGSFVLTLAATNASVLIQENVLKATNHSRGLIL